MAVLVFQDRLINLHLVAGFDLAVVQFESRRVSIIIIPFDGAIGTQARIRTRFSVAMRTITCSHARRDG